MSIVDRLAASQNGCAFNPSVVHEIRGELNPSMQNWLDVYSPGFAASSPGRETCQGLVRQSSARHVVYI